jgi:hypothetical protein
MSDNLSKRGPHDRTRISLKEEHEVRYWTEALGVSRVELERLVAQHGHMAAEIRARIAKR